MKTAFQNSAQSAKRSILFCCLLACITLPAVSQSRSLTEGMPAPDFRLMDQNGNMRRLSDFRGEVVVLNFWATWCRPCRTEVPWLDQLSREFAGKGVVILGVATDEQGWKTVTPFLEQYKVSYPVLLATPAVRKAWGGLSTLPQTYFLDRNLTIVARHSAILSRESLRKVIGLLAAPAENKR